MSESRQPARSDRPSDPDAVRRFHDHEVSVVPEHRPILMIMDALVRNPSRGGAT